MNRIYQIVHCVLLFAFYFIVEPSTFTQTTITLQPGPALGKDARVWSLQPGSNFAGHVMTKINAWTWSGEFGIERSFIEFDLSSLQPNSAISEAKLSLYYHGLPGNPEQTHQGSNYLLIRRIIESWSETGVTWNNQPASTETNKVIVPPSISPTQDYLDIDVTGMVQDALQSGSNSCGFSFQMKTEETYRRIGLSSSDHPNPERWPKLEIIYNCSVDLGNDTSFCQGDSVFLSAGDDYISYIWSNGNSSSGQWISEGGIYWVQVTDASDCVASDTIEITIIPNPTIQLNLGPDILACEGDIITLDAASGYDDYLWNTGDTTQTIEIMEGGLYYVIVSTYCGIGSDTIEVSFSPGFEINLGNDTLLCEGEQLTLDPGFGFVSYLWQDGTTTPFYDVITGGVYSVEVTDIYNCSDEDDIIVSFHDINLDLPSDTGFCANQSIELTIDSIYSSIFWMDSITNNSITISTEGQYWVTVIDSLEGKICSLSDTINVDAYLAPDVPQIPIKVYCCVGDSVKINGGAGSSFNYIWDDGFQDSIHFLSDPGNYEIFVFNSCDTVSASTQLIQWPSPEFQIQLIQDYETGGAVLRIDNPNDTALWSTGVLSPSITLEKPGIYWATIDNEYGCKSTDTLLVDPFDCSFIVPNFFTPNGDSYNQEFKIESSQIRKIEVSIFNRWGEKVFTSDKPDFAWDGKRNNYPCAEGTYYWIISYNCKGFINMDKMEILKGTLLLLR